MCNLLAFVHLYNVFISSFSILFGLYFLCWPLFLILLARSILPLLFYYFSLSILRHILKPFSLKPFILFCRPYCCASFSYFKCARHLKTMLSPLDMSHLSIFLMIIIIICENERRYVILSLRQFSIFSGKSISSFSFIAIWSVSNDNNGTSVSHSHWFSILQSIIFQHFFEY